jgi:parallel beta-helix repeat protein
MPKILLRALEIGAVVLTVCGHLFAASVVVGPASCKPTLVHFSTIQTAVDSVPAGSTVFVCPGNYGEQIHITKPLTLTGVAMGNSDQPVIVPPPGGLATNSVDEFGTTLALQLWVDNPGGPVNISSIAIDGTGNGVTICHPVVVGMFYENSAGTVNHVAIRNQTSAVSGCGDGFLAEGGPAVPTVSLLNSSIHNTDNAIYTQNQVNVIIKGNDVDVSASANGFGIVLDDGSNNTVSGNVITSSYAGVNYKPGSAGTVTANTVTNTPIAVLASSDAVSVTTNKLLNSSTAGVFVSPSAGVIQGNTITNSPIGIELNCFADSSVTGNTISDAQTGIDGVPTSLSVVNSFFNVQFKQNGGCP